MRGVNALQSYTSYPLGSAIASAETVYYNPTDPNTWKIYSTKWGITPSEALGIVNEDTSFWTARGLAGFGVDVFTDPSTYISLGSGGALKSGAHLTIDGSKRVLTKKGVLAWAEQIKKFEKTDRGEANAFFQFRDLLQNNPKLEKKYLTYEGIGLRAPFGLGEIELISKSTIKRATSFPRKTWDTGLAKLAVRGGASLEIASKLKKTELFTANTLTGLKQGIENKFIVRAAIKRLQRPPTLGPKADDFEAKYVRLHKATEYKIAKLLKQNINIEKRSKAAFGKDWEKQIGRQIEPFTDSPKIHLTGEQRSIIDYFKGTYKFWAEEETRRGLLENQIEYYAKHAATPEALKFMERGGKLSERIYAPLIANTRSSARRKLAGSIEHINKITQEEHGFKLFIENPIKAHFIRGVQHIKAVETYDFVEWVDKFYGTTPELAAKSGRDMSLSRIPQLKNRALPTEIVKLMDGDLIRTNPEKTMFQSILNAYTSAINLWKWKVTIMSPAYYPLNIIGGAFNNWLAGVTLKSYYRAGKNLFTKEGAPFETRLGEVWTKQRLLDEAGMRGELRQTGSTDLTSAYLSGGTLDTGLKPWLARRFEQSRWLNQQIENELRMAHIIDRLHKGDNIADAIASTGKHQIDYSPIMYTQFETKLTRYAFPFYKWPRGNIPLQLGYMLKEPAKPAATIRFANDQLQGDTAPAWAEGRLVLGYNKTKGTFTSTQLPLGDITGIVNNPVGYIVGAITPVKAIFESATGTNLFTGKPIKSKLEPFSNILLGPQGRLLNTWDSKGTPAGSKIMKSLGIGTYLTQTTIDQYAQVRRVLGSEAETYWTKQNEIQFKQTEYFQKLDEKYNQKELEIITATHDDRGRYLHATLKKQLLYEAHQKKNIKILNRQIAYIDYALNALQGQIYNDMAILKQLRKDHPDAAGVKKFITIMTTRIYATKQRMERYKKQRVQLNTIRQTETGKEFTITKTEQRPTGRESAMVALGAPNMYPITGSGPELLDETYLEGLIDPTKVYFDVNEQKSHYKINPPKEIENKIILLAEEMLPGKIIEYLAKGAS